MSFSWLDNMSQEITFQAKWPGKGEKNPFHLKIIIMHCFVWSFALENMKSHSQMNDPFMVKIEPVHLTQTLRNVLF